MKKSLLVLVLLAVSACKSKGSACSKVNDTLDPIIKELDAVPDLSEKPPSPADQSSCAQLTAQARVVENAEAKLALLITDDAELAKRLDVYRKNVGFWSKTTRLAQLGCLGKDGNAMTTAMSKSIEARAQLAPAASEIKAYCKAP